MTILSDKFYSKGREFLGCEYPIICGAMTWVSEPNLVSAVCNAGAFGCLAGGNTPVDILEKQIHETQEKTDKPFAVNLITIAPAFQTHMEMITKKNLPYVVFAGGMPKADELKAIKDTGAKVMVFSPTASIAKRMVKLGADAIILEGMEAGGHIGQISLTVLIQEVLFGLNDIPVFLGGGIANGRMCAHMLMMGAAGVQMGTRFVMSEECTAHANFKKIFRRANARDAITTQQFDSRLPVAAVRALRNKGFGDFGKLQLDLLKKIDSGEIERGEAQLKIEEFWMGALRRAVVDGDTDYGSLMAGQSVGLVKAIQPVKEIIDEIAGDVEKELKAMHELLV